MMTIKEMERNRDRLWLETFGLTVGDVPGFPERKLEKCMTPEVMTKVHRFLCGGDGVILPLTEGH